MPNFTEFNLNPTPAGDDFIVGYKSDGSAEYRATAQSLATALSSATVISLSTTAPNNNIAARSGTIGIDPNNNVWIKETGTGTSGWESIFTSTSGAYYANIILQDASGVVLNLGELGRVGSTVVVGDGSTVGGIVASTYTLINATSSIQPIIGDNLAQGIFSNVAGGQSNRATGNRSTVVGGVSSLASGNCSFVGGGCCNSAQEIFSNVVGGLGNTASGYYSFVGGGRSNNASCGCSTVGGGNSNTASGSSSTVGGGRCNTACSSSSTVGGGTSNTACSPNSTVGGGTSNTASGTNSTVGGGNSNTASGACSFVAGGRCNDTRGFTNTFILGSSLSATVANFTYVNNLSSQGVVVANPLRIGNSLSATGPVGTVTGKVEVFNAAGSSLGFIPIYDTIT